MQVPERLGNCSICWKSVRAYGDGKELIRQGGELVPHRHKKAYTIKPIPEPDRESWRDWIWRLPL